MRQLSEKTDSPPHSFAYALTIISLCAAFLFYKYVLQVYPSIITQSLMQTFQLTGAGLGNLAATFYYAYMVAQLVVGVMLDKYSTRWLTASAIFCCALGVLLFSQSHSLLLAALSRGLMGVGVAFATVAYMKLAANWFKPKYYALVGGLLATAAMAGAVFGQAPLAFGVSLLGWRQSLLIIAIVGFLLAFSFALIVRDKPQGVTTDKPTPIAWHDIWQVIKSKQNWLLTLYGGLAFSPIAIFGGLWGHPFLMQAFQLNETQAAFMVSLVFIGLGLGSPILGWLSDQLNARRLVMFVSTTIACIAISLVIYAHTLPIPILGTLLFMFGFGLGAFMLVFTIGKEINSAAVTATVIAMINASDAVLDAITEPGIGKLLDLNWDGTLVNGVHYFSLHSYHVALTILPLYLAIAIVLLFWIKTKAA